MKIITTFTALGILMNMEKWGLVSTVSITIGLIVCLIMVNQEF